MSATLTIRVPDHVWKRLNDRALLRGTSPEEIAAEELTRTASAVSAADPLLRWAGGFESQVPDAAERHDDYLGEALASELTGQGDVR